MAASRFKLPESLYIASSIIEQCFFQGVESYVYN